MTKKGPKLLSGDNPQIPKGYGQKPVSDYLDAVPGWKQDVCREIDSIVSAKVDNVQKAVKWNSPLYGIEKDHYFLSFHCFARYVKITFFRGTQLEPPPPGSSAQADVRYLDVHEGDKLGKQFVSWVEQASKLPGQKM